MVVVNNIRFFGCSNILIRRNGEIKLCDFGISGTLVESLAQTRNVGCNLYMAVRAVSVLPLK